MTKAVRNTNALRPYISQLGRYVDGCKSQQDVVASARTKFKVLVTQDRASFEILGPRLKDSPLVIYEHVYRRPIAITRRFTDVAASKVTISKISGRDFGGIDCSATRATHLSSYVCLSGTTPQASRTTGDSKGANVAVQGISVDVVAQH